MIVANWQDLEYATLCERLEVKIQGQVFFVDVYTLTLNNYDLIFGAQWLANLEGIVWNFRELTMSFWMGNQQYYL